MLGQRHRIALPLAIGFDFDHTLGIDNKLERVALLQVGRRAFEAGGTSPGSLVSETTAIDKVLLEQRAGRRTIDDAVAGFVRNRGIADPLPLVAFFRTFCLDNARAFIVPVPGAPEAVRAIQSRGIRCAILTNGWSPLQELKAECVGFAGPVLVSASIGTEKPKRRAFQHLCDTLASAPSQTWYVGDNPITDVLGSLNAGLTAVWFDAEGVPYPRSQKKAAKVIHSFGELQSLLNSLKERSAST